MTAKVFLKKIDAPIEKNEVVGKIVYYINEKKWQEEKLFCEKEVQKIDFMWCLKEICRFYWILNISHWEHRS